MTQIVISTNCDRNRLHRPHRRRRPLPRPPRGATRPTPVRAPRRAEAFQHPLPPLPRRALRRHARRRAAVSPQVRRAGVGDRPPAPLPILRGGMGGGVRPRAHLYAPRPNGPRGGRPVLPRRACRHGAGQAATSPARVRRLRAAPRAAGRRRCRLARSMAARAAKRQRLLLAFGGFAPRLEPLADYYSALYWSWTPRQRRAATLLRLGPPAFAAAQLQVDRSAVSHLARRMAWPLVAAGDKMFRAALLETP